MKKKIVLLDWNGTLLDDVPIWYASVLKIFEAFDKQAPSLEQIFRELEGDYMSIYSSRGITASREELNSIYEPTYESMVGEASLSKSVRATLFYFKNEKVKLGLVTTQQERLVTPLLQKFEIDDIFEQKFCRFHALNKTEAITDLLQEASLQKEECVFLGDSPSDIRHGKKAGVKTGAFLNGHVPIELIEQAKPDFCFSSWMSLPGFYLTA
jgi:HAD superfamily hydrolase (TIGR01549 family)